MLLLRFLLAQKSIQKEHHKNQPEAFVLPAKNPTPCSYETSGSHFFWRSSHAERMHLNKVFFESIVCHFYALNASKSDYFLKLASFVMMNRGFQGMEQNRVRFLLTEKNKAERGLKGQEVFRKLFGYSIDSFFEFLPWDFIN